MDARTAWYLDCKEAIVARLTGTIATDPSGASAFRLVDPTTALWSADRCHLAGIDPDRLAPIRPADAVIGRLTSQAAALTGLQPGTPVVTGAGDVPASQIGAGATRDGDIHLSLGTAVYFGIVLDRPRPDPARRLGPLAHVVPGEWLLWLEIATGGAALSWLDRQLAGFGDGKRERDHGALDLAVADVADEMEGLLFAPWLTGERVPLFDDDARAAFVGLALHHGPAHLVRAVMEGVACQIAWAYEYGLAYGVTTGTIRAVGGGSIGSAWTRIIAETLGRPIEIVADPQEAGARGAAACALVGLGLADDLRTAVPTTIERVVAPDADRVDGGRARLDRFRALHGALRTTERGPVAPDYATAEA
jgi:xylulokinase